MEQLPGGSRFHPPTRLVGAQARIERRRSAFILVALSLLACCLMFPPAGWGWLGYVCLVPWLVFVCTFAHARFVYLLSWLFGLGYVGINIRWMIPVTVPGYVALFVYASLFFPLAAWPIRHMHKRHGVSVALTAAIVWTAAEYLRCSGELAFPWLLLGHTQYKLLTMIQISDLVGVYGVSFVLAMVNGWITDLLIQPILIWRADQIARLPLGTAALALVLAGTVAYGFSQRSSRTFEPGPRVAVVQHDFPMYVDERARRTDLNLVFRSYLTLGEQAAEEKPDLIVFPETALSGYMNEEFLIASPGQLDEIRQRRFPPDWTHQDIVALQSFSRRVREAFQQLATNKHVPIVLGSLAMEWKPTAIPPRAEAFNSTFLLVPNRATPAARYDKNHLVLFGEYVPFRYSYPWLYQWLNSITPWGRAGIDYSLTPGGGFLPFEFVAQSKNGRRYRAGTPICYEEIMPYVGRAFVRAPGAEVEKNIDMLLTMSNDGWFLHTAELEQHLAGAVFRAVENRISIARSVNTGASAFIHPSGRIVDRVELLPEHLPQLDAAAQVLDKLRQSIASLSLESAPDLTETMKVLGELHGRLAVVGKAFVFMEERLSQLTVTLASPNEVRRREALAIVKDQLEEDVQTVRRWQREPGTAPGYRVSEVQCDSRMTLYARWGDWFGQGAAALTGMMLLDWLLRRVWGRVASRGVGEERGKGE